MLVNTLPLKIELSDGTIKNFVEETAKMFNASIEHENYPFAQLAADYNFIPQIMFEYQRGVVENVSLPKFIGSENFEHKTSKFKPAVRILDENNLPQGTNTKLINTCELTETVIFCNMKDLTHAEIISVGGSLLNVTEFVVDSEGNELPLGIVGELYIGGAGVAKGYNNPDEMTAKKFITCKNLRVYKSGDYAHRTSSGDVEILTEKTIRLNCAA